jgi:hypothetical protein
MTLKFCNVCFCLLFTLILSNIVNSQTRVCDIHYINGTGIYKTRIYGQYRDMILVSDSNSYKIVDIVKIKSLRFDRGNHMWTGVGVGAGLGFILGIFMYERYNSKNSQFFIKDPAVGIPLIFTIPCAVLGGAIGTLFEVVDNYYLSKMGMYMKIKEVNYIRKEQSLWR